MRAVPLLVAFSTLDLAVVAVAGITHPEGVEMDSLRITLGGIVAITGIALVALAALSLAARWLGRLHAAAWRAVGGLLVGGAYGAAILGSLAWAALWLSPEFAPVALAGVACAALLAWQSWAGTEMERITGASTEAGQG